MATPSRILIVDDDAELCSMLREYLTSSGLEAVAASRGAAALKLCDAEPPDLVILDVSMPGLDGFEVLQRLRERTRLPVIFLTGRDEDDDRIQGLELGADDYLTKPFNARELLARIHAILRRTVVPLAADGKLDLGVLQIESVSRQVRVAGERVDLTDAEFRVLEMLASHAGKVVTRAQLTRVALGRPWLGLDRSIDTHVSALRRKLGSRFEEHMTLQGVRGIGYALRPAATRDTHIT